MSEELDYIGLYIYMLAIAGQTAGPNCLTFFEETHGYIFEISQATPGILSKIMINCRSNYDHE